MESRDKRRHAKESMIQIGDTVLVKQYKQNKLKTRFNKMPYIVLGRKGTKVTAEHSNHRITRNLSHFKRVNANVNSQYNSSTVILNMNVIMIIIMNSMLNKKM